MGMRARGVVLLSALALVACGDDESGSGTTATAAGTGPVATTPANADEPDESAAPAATVPAPTDPPISSSPATAPPSTDASTCNVTITGAVSAEWTSDASGPSAFVYGGWLANPSTEDAGAFGLNCFDSDFNIVGFFAAPDTTVPMEPATFQLGPDGGETPMAADVALATDDGLWETTSGTLQILEFDAAHIRGTFSLAIRDSFDESRTAEVSGAFAHSR